MPNSSPRRWTLCAFAVLLFTVGIAGALERKAMVPLLVLTVIPAAAILGLPSLRGFNPIAALRAAPMVACAVALTVWAAITSFWGYDVHLLTLLRVIVTVVLCTALVRAVAALPTTFDIDRWMIAGSFLLVGFLIEEQLSDAWISTLLHPEPKFQAPGTFYRHVFDVAAGGGAVLGPTCVAVAALIYVRWHSKVGAIAYYVVALLATLRLPMAAAPLALILSGAAFVCGYFFRRFTFAAMFLGLGFYLFAAPAISFMMSPLTSISVPEVAPQAYSEQDVVSRRARLGIWHHVAELVADAPILGHGFEAARDLSAREERLPGSDLPALPIHPHNGALQIWLELGAVGALIVAGFLAAAWRATAVLWNRPLAGAVVAGTMAGALVPILVSFSLWNTWWIATLGFTAAFAARAVRIAPPVADESA